LARESIKAKFREYPARENALKLEMFVHYLWSRRTWFQTNVCWDM